MLWCIDSFTWFMQGRLIENKKMETIVKAVNKSWKIPFGIPSVGYFTKNEKELKEIKMYEWIEG